MPEKETTKPKNIYEKMTTIKKKLQGIKKSGENKYSEYTYFDLGDILPTLLLALEEERLFMKTEFSATEPTAKLIILEMDDPNNRIEYETRVGTCALKASHDIQNLGASQTYTRRYLIMTAFDITDNDIVDAGAAKEEPKGNQNNYQKQQKQQKPAEPKNQEPLKPKQNYLETLKRDAWELIKKLPKEQQEVWLESCKGANESVLNEIINEVKKIIISRDANEKEPMAEASPQNNIAQLRKDAWELINKFPAEKQDKWISQSKGASPTKLQQLIKDMNAELKAESQETAQEEIPSVGQKQQNGVTKEELEIF